MANTSNQKKKLLSNKLVVKLFPLHEKQQEIKNDDHRFKVLACGRRWGKSMLAKEEGLDRAINRSQKVWFVSPTYNNVQTHWREVKRIVGDLPTYKNEQQHYMEFEREDGRVGSLAFKSGDRPDNLLGDGLDFIIVDEAAYQDPELWQRVLRPSLSDRNGGALLISTPNGTVNWFYSAYLYGQDPRREEWGSWRYVTLDSPFIKPSEIEAAKDELPDQRFRQEYLAEFMSDAGGVFRGVDLVAKNAILSEPDPERYYVCGIDWGRKNDFTVVSIFDDLGNQVAIERFTDIGFAVQTSKIKALYDKWQFRTMYVESNSIGAPNIEALEAEGLPVVSIYMTNVLKVALVERLASNIEQQRITLITKDEKVGELQIGELLSYSMERTHGGINITYNAPKGWHDDIVVATMLVNSHFQKAIGSTVEVVANPFYKNKQRHRFYDEGLMV